MRKTNIQINSLDVFHSPWDVRDNGIEKEAREVKNKDI